jgi:hypothetical protein
MKTYIYAAAIALLTASTAFAQSNNPAPADANSGMAQHSGDKASAPRHMHRHMAGMHADRSQDSREDRITMQLNRQQLADNGNMSAPGMSGNAASFNNGAPQQAQAGGANCTPDRPDCGTARDNPAINSSPQQRTYNAGTGVGQ